MKDDKEAPAGTLRAAVETLTVDLSAALAKMKASLSARGEATTPAELIATTHAQVRLVKAVQSLERLAGGMLTTTAELREACGIPITDQELEAGCDCPHCKAKRAVMLPN